MKITRKPVQGTSRQRVLTANGTELERQFVYADRDTWNALRRLAAKQGVSGSIVISQLINLAAWYSGETLPATE